jgi:hypothetical protein
MKTTCRLRGLTTALSTFVLLASASLLQASDGQFLTAEASLTKTSSTTPATIAAGHEEFAKLSGAPLKKCFRDNFHFW